MQEIIERLLTLQQIGNTVSFEVQQLLARLYALIEMDLRRQDPTGVALRYRRGRQELFMARLRERVKEFLPAMQAKLKERLAQLGRQQSMMVRDRLIATLGDSAGNLEVPVTQARMRAILNTEPFQGRVLADHGRKLGVNLVDRVNVQLRLGMVREESIDDLVRRIRGRRVAGSRAFTGGVLSATTRETEALVRTAVDYVANRGMLDTFRANPDVLDGVRYTAVLDDRTTDICLALDGREWDLDDEKIVVPGRDTHYNCRSLLTPIIAWKRLGFPEPPAPRRIVRDLSTVSDEDLERSISARRRAGAFGDVTHISSNQTATEWLRRQRAAVQDHMLGRRRAELFRAGKLDLRRLITEDLRRAPLSALEN